MARKRRRSTIQPLPLLWAELASASMETIARRTQMMAGGRCTPAEYQRMVAEKMRAAGQSSLAAFSPSATTATLLSPWHRAARRNARRLRKK